MSFSIQDYYTDQEKYNLMMAIHYHLVIRNEALYNKYPGGVERLKRKYDCSHNDYITLSVAMAQPYLIDLVEDLRSCGMQNKTDYVWSEEDLISKSTMRRFDRKPPTEDLFGYDEKCNWLRRYHLYEGNCISFTGYGIPYYIIKTDTDVLLQIEVVFASKVFHADYSAVPKVFGDYPAVVFIDCAYPFNGYSLSSTARQKLINHGENLAIAHDGEVWVQLLADGIIHIRPDGNSEPYGYHEMPDLGLVSFNEMRKINRADNEN